MPRNLKGGKSHKKLASKNNKQDNSFIKVRYKDINEPCEIYARVLSVYGGGMLEVYCDDGVKRLCVIRRKFKGRNKRDNQISVNSILLVGKIDWEVRDCKKKEKVDLLYVYSESHVTELRKKKLSIFEEFKNEEDDILYDNLAGDSEVNIKIKKTKKSKETSEENEKLKGDIDWDDI